MSLIKNLYGRLQTVLITPIKALRWRYIPLLTVYFAYGASSIGSITFSFWVKEEIALSAMQLSAIAVWASMPWTIKMIWGQLIDHFPLFGSRRKAYVYVGAGLTAFGLSVFASMAGHLPWVSIFGGIFNSYLVGSVFMALGFAVQDAAADTMSTEVVPRYFAKSGRKRPEKDIKADLAMVQLLGRLALSIGILSVAKLSGTLAQAAQAKTYLTYQTVFWGMLFLPLLAIFGTMFIRLEQDVQKKKKDYRGIDPVIFTGGLCLGFGTIVLGFLQLQEVMFVLSLGIVSWMVFRLTKDYAPEYRTGLYRTLVAIFIFRLTPSVGAGLSWWLIDVLHFDPAFFGTLNQIGAFIPVLILWFLADTLAHKPIRAVLLFLIFVGTLLSFPDVLLYYGGPVIQANARAITIVSTALESPLVHVSMVPLLALIAFYAPEKNRGTWFAVASSLLNLALTGSELFTKQLNQIFVVTRGLADPVTGAVISVANYSQLGPLLLLKIGITFAVPLIGVLVFLPKKTENTQRRA